MLLSVLAWLEGASISLAACILLGLFDSNGDPGRLAAFVAAVGFGLLGPRNRRTSDPSGQPLRQPFATWRDSLCFAALTAASVALGTLVAPAALGALLRTLVVVPAAFAGGRLLWRLTLYAGVLRTRRIHVFGLAVVGLVMGPLLHAVDVVSPLGVLGVLVLVLIAVVGTSSAREVSTPTPPPAPWTDGLPTSLAMLGFGAGAGAVLAWATADVSSRPDVSFTSVWAAGLGVGTLGALVVILFEPRVRRVGVHAGGSALVAAGAALFARQHPSIVDPVAALVGAAGAIGAIFIGVPLLLVSYAVTPTPRFYATLPPGGKIIELVPEEERPLPAGAPLRVGLFAIGLAFGLVLVGFGPADAVALGPGLLAASGAALILADPRAGPARKATVLSATSAIAAALAWA